MNPVYSVMFKPRKGREYRRWLVDYPSHEEAVAAAECLRVLRQDGDLDYYIRAEIPS